MFGWLQKKGQNSRVFMCTKEVLWEVENATSAKRAMIHALAQLLRVEMLEASGIPLSIFDRPLDFPREDLMQVYGQLEDIRNTNTSQIGQLKKMTRQYGLEFPDFAEAHARNTGRALEVWMSTLGIGIVPDRRDEVRMIWRYLIASKEYLPAAMAELRNVGALTVEMTDAADNIFDNITEDYWLDACEFVPAAVQRGL